MYAIENALKEGRTALSEHESKQVLASYGIPVTREILVRERELLPAALEQIGLPVAMKWCSPHVGHKTEKALIRLDIRSSEEAETAFEELCSGMDTDGSAVLVQELVKGPRELMVGLTRDSQFGPCVMFGLGGIFTEILHDVSFRLAPLEYRDAMEMMTEIRGRKILEGFRGMEPVDLDLMAKILIALGQLGVEHETIKEIDVNPLIIRGRNPVAVDALVVLQNSAQ